MTASSMRRPSPPPNDMMHQVVIPLGEARFAWPFANLYCLDYYLPSCLRLKCLLVCRKISLQIGNGRDGFYVLNFHIWWLSEWVMAGYWGPVTASTEWCETNYKVSPYLGEFFNTVSNVPMLVLAIIGLSSTMGQRFEKRFSALHLSSITIAIGSILFHATLKYSQQQSDETPMVWLMLLYIYVLYSPDWHYTSTMPTFLFIYGTAYAICHSLFHFVLVYQLHFIFLCLLCLPRMYKYYIYTTEVPARRLGHMYLISISLGGICWLVDRNFCTRLSSLPANPQGHAWWHIFMGFSAYFGNTFLQFCRAQQLEWNPELRYVVGWLPYVKICKPKSR